jgi:D-amino-acid dehydrogenase
MKVVVLGAGVIGITTAFFLTRAGHEVRIIDRQVAPGLETSFSNGALLTPGMSDPWAAPGITSVIVRGLGHPDAPFSVRLQSVPGLLNWGWRFLRNASPERWRRNTEIVLQLATLSNVLLEALSKDLGLSYHRGDRGNLRIYQHDVSLLTADIDARVYRDRGVRVILLDRDACIRLEPALKPVARDIAGGLHYADDRSGDCFKFTQGLASVLAKLGAEFSYSTNILGFDTLKGRVRSVVTDRGPFQADAFVLACGSYSAPLMKSVGLRLPICPVKGYSATFPIGNWTGAPSIPIVDYHRKMVVIRLGDRIRLAGTAEFAGFDRQPNPIRSEMLIRAFKELFPNGAIGTPVEHWNGLRPMCPDGRPIIGASNCQNLFLNVGHGALGWTLSCGSAKVLADLIGGGPTPISTTGFSYTRFA